MEIAFVLSLLVITVILFATEKIPVDIITLIMVVLLTASRIISPQEAFAGFSSDFILILASIFVIGAALDQTGILEFMIARLVRLASKSSKFMLFIVLLVSGLISAFMNNTTVTAMFVTPLVGVARKLKTSSSQYLMPLAYASILGGTCTLIGTSTNVAVSGFITKAKLEPIGLFEITPIGLILFGVGLVYMMTIGRKLLPDRGGQKLTEEYNIQRYLTEILVLEDSNLIGQTVFSSDISRLSFRILNIIRNKENFLPDFRTRIRAGDIILVEGDIKNLMKVKETKGIEIRADVLAENDLESDKIRLAEILVTGQSEIHKKTVKEVDFLTRYGLVVLAISRKGETIRTKISNITLRIGDLLLVQGAADRLNDLRDTQRLTILEEFEPVLYKKRKGLIAVFSFITAIIIGTIGWLPLSVAFLLAAIITVLTKCISADRVYQTIDWRLLILIAGMTAFGTAMENSGAAEFLAKGIVHLLADYGKIAILLGFVILTVILTQPMSNAAAALVIVPVAIRTATELNSDPRSFAIAIMLAASVSLITPFEPSCILVYGPGKYRFRDFIKVGSPLTFILILVIVALVPFFWPI